jgi:hypothetical protein
MDYFQGVVTEFLRAKRTQFVNTEYMINLDVDGTYKKDRHWYCDAVAINFADSTVHLCEVTYSKTLQSLVNRLQAWCNHWPEVIAAIRRDSALTDKWKIVPRLFVPEDLKSQLAKKISALKWPADCVDPMPDPIITTLEEVLPWRYRSWNGKPFADDRDA